MEKRIHKFINIMGCQVWYYEIREDTTYQDILADAKRNWRLFEEDIKELERKDIPLYEVIEASNYEIIEGHLCYPIKKAFPLFRTYNEEDEPLYCLEDTLAHIDRYYRLNQRFSYKVKRWLRKVFADITIWYYDYFWDTHIAYSHSSMNRDRIDLNGSYANTIAHVKDFWDKYPNAIIIFG